MVWLLKISDEHGLGGFYGVYTTLAKAEQNAQVAAETMLYMYTLVVPIISVVEIDMDQDIDAALNADIGTRLELPWKSLVEHET